ncbi:MAG: hypothetical protein KF698_07185 [Anaerolineales bacterium]|nr:hypothetical protein [Anaerolineales bacterium]
MSWRRNFVVVLTLGLLLAACTSPRANNPETIPSPYTLEPVFEDFYAFLGGPQRAGAVISPGIVEGNIQKQYIEAGLMVYNPALAPSEQFSLAPLGQQLGVWDAPLPDGNLQDALFVEGYIIYEGFEDLYRQLGGQRYVGKPLTGMRFLQDQSRVEQYFENLGFYLDLDESLAGVRFIDYGRQICGQGCGVPASSPPAVVHPELAYGEPFTSVAAALGQAVTGPRLAGPYQLADGSLEVIYQNMVLYVPPGQPATVLPRPLTSLLGILPEPRVTRLENANLVFHALDGNFGYNVPLVFDDYITQHGGYAAFGAPIAELQPTDGGASQCFVNACLRYQSGAVSLLPLGVEYRTRFYDQGSPLAQAAFEKIRIDVWEARAQVSSTEGQTIYASLHANGQLLQGLQPFLELTAPSGETWLYTFPATDANGQTQLSVPPVQGQNWELVVYKVCLDGLNEATRCTTDSYRIWGNP